MKKNVFTKILSVTLAVLIAAPSLVTAASLSDISDEMTDLTKSAVSSHQIQFVTPSGVQYTDTIILTFESDFVIGNLALADINLAEGNTVCASFGADMTLASAPAPSVWGVATTSSTITFTAPDDTAGQITDGNCLQIQLGTSAGGTNLITNPTTAESYTIGYTGSFNDTGTSTVRILDNSQVAVTAEVPQSLTFSVSTSTIGFGDLSSSQVRYADNAGGSDSAVIGNTLSAGTNASSGYSITVKGATLTSGLNTITALGTPADPTTDTKQFGIRIVASGSGDGVAVSPYNHATNFAYSADAATTDVVAEATASTATNNFSVYYLASIASQTEAGSYSTTLTYVGTANF